MAPSSSKTLQHTRTVAFRRAANRLAHRIRKLRTDRGWTIEVAAERCNIEPAHVRRIESGDANPTLGVLVSIAKAYGLTVAALLDETHTR